MSDTVFLASTLSDRGNQTAKGFDAKSAMDALAPALGKPRSALHLQPAHAMRDGIVRAWDILDDVSRLVGYVLMMDSEDG